MGYSLGEDRILDELKKAKDESEKNSSIKFPPHFAFLSRKWEEEDDKKFAEVLEKSMVFIQFFMMRILCL